MRQHNKEPETVLTSEQEPVPLLRRRNYNLLLEFRRRKWLFDSAVDLPKSKVAALRSLILTSFPCGEEVAEQIIVSLDYLIYRLGSPGIH